MGWIQFCSNVHVAISPLLRRTELELLGEMTAVSFRFNHDNRKGVSCCVFGNTNATTCSVSNRCWPLTTPTSLRTVHHQSRKLCNTSLGKYSLLRYNRFCYKPATQATILGMSPAPSLDKVTKKAENANHKQDIFLDPKPWTPCYTHDCARCALCACGVREGC